MVGLLHNEYLATLWRAHDAATPGPWTVGLEQHGVLAGCPTVIRSGPRGYRVVSIDQAYPFTSGDDRREAVANVAFIAAARTAVPALLAENRRLRALLSLNDKEQLNGAE
jgi:hypothetical protein